MIGSNPSLEELASAFQAWLTDRRDAHAHLKQLPADFEGKMERLIELQRDLFDSGWALYGWSEDTGGRGGTVLHRALMLDLLERNGYPPRHLFEHMDILPPALERFASPSLVGELFLPTLRGDVLWCQGFSEPTAGSDLAALRTRAERTEDGYRVDGHKTWTSWAKWASHCLFLARTGKVEDRHRGLTAFVVRVDSPGIQVGPIQQATGSEELAEVFFDGVFVPEANRVGEEGEGWAVAMHILAGERGSYGWLRQSELLPRLEALAREPGASEHAGILGDSLIRLIALRCRTRKVMEIIASGLAPGPESSVSKVLVIDAEQHFYDVAREVLSPALDLGDRDDAHFWQEHYLYSRAASVYGGSRQIQMNVIAKLLVTRGDTHGPEDEELAVVRSSVAEALEKSEDTRDALSGLDWWAFAAAPDDAFGRTAFGAWFEGQGRTLATSPALAGVRGAAAAEALGVEPGELALAFPQPSGNALACGLDARTKHVLIAANDGVLQSVPAAGLAAETSHAFDTGLLVQVALPEAASKVAIDAGVDARALALARIAASCEILGACRELLDRAVDHTNEREQFGQPISRFQAVQHLIAESQVDVSALAELCDSALEEWSAGGDPELPMAVKAFAGRAGRSVAQRALQCFGAIGFTEENGHHHYSRRIHTLDAILGTQYALRRELGMGIVRTGVAPRGIEAYRPSSS